MSLKRRCVCIVVAVLLVGVVGISGSLGAPTLTSITIDGGMADWAAVLANPDNVVLDGPGGGLIDADTPSAARDIDKVAYTWDATYLYFYVHRQGSSGEFNYFWFHFDLNNDGRVANDAPLLNVAWWGTNGKTTTTLDLYKAAQLVLGDPITNPMGQHDGYKLPGNRAAGAVIETLNGGSAGGLEMETRVLWASLGVAAGTAFRFHLSSTRKLNDYPSSIADNTGRTVAFPGVILDPDRAASTPPTGSLVMAHTISNTGGIADIFDLTWTSAGAFAPSSVNFYRDADGSGTLTPGDTLFTDTDGDGPVDTGPIAAGAAPLLILAVAVIPASPTIGQVATVTLRARSSLDTSVSDTAVDTITIVQPSLTLVKTVDAANAPPGAVLLYTVTYSNTGTSDAVTVDIVDPVPAGTTYVTGSASGAGMTVAFSHDGGASYDGMEAAPVTHVRWMRALPLAPAGSGTVTFQAAVD